MINNFLEMVRIPSESGDENEFLQYLEGKLRYDIGAVCCFDPYSNLIARLPGKNTIQTKPVLFELHADTVKPGKEIQPVIQDDIISSSGNTILGTDDKAGIAEVLEV